MSPSAGVAASGRAEDRADARARGAVGAPGGSAAPQPGTAEAAPAGAAGGLPAGVATIVGVRLLGRFTVLRGAEEVPLRAFGGRQPQQLLRLLVLRRPALVPKDAIAEALWPQRRPLDAGGNIEVLVSRARRALGDRTLIGTGPGGYSLAGGDRCWVDAEAFVAAVRDGRRRLAERPAEALALFRSALELWRGEPLAEDAYAEWAQEHRRRLGRVLLQALEGAANAALLTGDPQAAVTWAERAAAGEPLREASAMLAVRALAVGGDQVGALAVFDSFRRRLARETGLDASPGALELRQQILHGEPTQLAPGAGKPARRPARLSPGLSWAARTSVR